MPDSIQVGDSLVKTGLRYSKTHEWINLNESPSSVGISDYAQKSLHDLVYVELPKVGQSLTKGSILCTLESVKAVAEAYSPVDGEVVQVNEVLSESPELVNKDPYGRGWLVKIKVKGETKSLLSPEEYSDIVKKLL
jgi:glycine cleavage system H protein